MKQYLKVALVLFSICAVAGILLAAINQVTAPVIALNVQAETETALAAVSGGRELGEQREGDGGDVNYVIPLLENGEITGYILELNGAGYGGAFTVVASYNTDGSVISAKMMSNSETPGLGKKAEESWYMQMFAGLGGSQALPSSKNDLADPAAVGGATVTFNGVTGAIRTGSELVKTFGGR